MSARDNAIRAQLDELAEADVATKLEALAWAGREGDEQAGELADALCCRGEWES